MNILLCILAYFEYFLLVREQGFATTVKINTFQLYFSGFIDLYYLRVPEMPGGSGGLTGIAHFIAEHKQIQLNRACYFPFFVVFLVSK